MDKTIVQIPALVFAYNLFMNGVHRFDQLRASHITTRQEPLVAMSSFTFFLDGSTQNGYALYCAVSKARY